jgi:hypothetical protein
MKLSLSRLRSLIREAISASEDYMKKERIREDLQDRVIEAVMKGDIKDEKDLVEYFKTVDMAVKALKMIPYDVFVKLAKQK